MKKFTVLPFLLLTIVLSVQGQPGSKLKFNITTGIAAPVTSVYFDNFSGNRTPGISLGAGAGYALTPRSSFIVRYDYNRFWYDEDSYSSFDHQNEADIYANYNLKRAITIKGLYKFTLVPDRPVAAPYLIAGLGAIELKERDGILAVSQNESATTEVTYRYWEAIVALGGGFNFKVHPHLNLILEVRYDIVTDKYDEVQFIPVKVGIEF